MDVHYTPGLDVYKALWKELYTEFLRLKKAYLGVMAATVLFKRVLNEIKPPHKRGTTKSLRSSLLTLSEFLNRVGNKAGLQLLGALCGSGSLEQLIDRSRLDQWYQWFKYAWHKTGRYRKNWLHHFEEIVQLAPPPEIPAEQFAEEVSDIRPAHISRHQTGVGQSFGAIILSHPSLFKQLTAHLSKPYPDVVLSLLPDYTVSVRARNHAIEIIGLLLDQGNIRAHETRGPIYFPRQPLFRLLPPPEFYSPSEYLIYGFLFFDELVERLVKSRQFSADPSDLFPFNIARIQPQDTVLPDIESLKLFTETQEAIAKLIRKGRAGSLPIEFPGRKILSLPYGTTTLFFTQRQYEFGLTSFLHYLLQRYLLDTKCQEAPNPPKVLYIDTTEFTLRPWQLIAPSMAKTYLKLFRHLQIDDYPQLLHFIKTELKHIILQDNIELTVLQGLFDLFDEHLAQETLTRQMFYFKRSQTAQALIDQLATIALQTHSCILLMKMNAMTIEDPERPDVGKLQPALAFPFLDRLTAKPQFFFRQATRTFHLAPKAWRVLDEEGRFRIEYPKGCLKIGRPAKLEPFEMEPPAFLQEVIRNLKALEQAPPSPPTIPEPELAVSTSQPVPPEWVDKLFEPPSIQETDYGLIFRIWHFKARVQGIYRFLQTEHTMRHFDLLIWYNGTYSIFNSEIDLSPLERVGGKKWDKGPFAGRSMYFHPDFEGFLAFKEFIRYLHKNPLPLRPL